MSYTDNSKILILKDAGAVAEEGARRFVQLAQQAITTHGRFSIALSGGNTPRLLYTTLTRPPYRDSLDWSNIYIFWGDERFVSPDDRTVIS